MTPLPPSTSTPPTYPKLDMNRMAAFVRWYKKLQASQKTGFMIAALSLIALPTAIIMNARVTENRSKAANIVCKTTGCEHQLCIDSRSPDIIAECAWQPKYACSKYSRCEVQPSGMCGWTKTPAYTQCLTDAK